MKAIKDTHNVLAVAADISDSVGIIDSYFPDAAFFTEPERFDRYIDKLRSTPEKIDYLSVCTPNYLHDAHIRLGLRNDCDVIYEKPIVINYKNLHFLEQLSKETNKNVYCILQLRLHEDIVKLKQKIMSAPADKKFKIDLVYITSRGVWYDYSWKADVTKSGGLITNIGIHFFDMLMWIFGHPEEWSVKKATDRTISGTLNLPRANINWLLSYDHTELPPDAQAHSLRTYRSITIDNTDFEFSNGFTDLHTTSYKEILKGNGFTLEDVKPSIKLVNDLRLAIK